MTITMNVSTGGSGPNRFRFLERAVRWADEVGPLGRAELKAEAPVGKGPRAGRLRDDIRYSRTTTATGVRAEWRAYTPYAGYVIGGTKPHEIRAVAARALHWRDSDGDHFARSVHHPGTKPNRFHERAMQRVTPAAITAFRHLMEAP